MPNAVTETNGVRGAPNHHPPTLHSRLTPSSGEVGEA